MEHYISCFIIVFISALLQVKSIPFCVFWLYQLYRYRICMLRSEPNLFRSKPRYKRKPNAWNINFPFAYFNTFWNRSIKMHIPVFYGYSTRVSFNKSMYSHISEREITNFYIIDKILFYILYCSYYTVNCMCI